MPIAALSSKLVVIVFVAICPLISSLFLLNVGKPYDFIRTTWIIQANLSQHCAIWLAALIL